MVQTEGQISAAELEAFADGSLPPRRRAQVATRIQRLPELRATVGEQRAALDGQVTIVCRPRRRWRSRLGSDDLLELAAWNGSRDTARIHNGLLPRLARAIHRPAA